MSKFADIYLRVIKLKTLKDDISVTNLPDTIKQDIEMSEQNKAVIKAIRDADTQRAKQKLLIIRQQLAIARKQTND